MLKNVDYDFISRWHKFWFLFKISYTLIFNRYNLLLAYSVSPPPIIIKILVWGWVNPLILNRLCWPLDDLADDLLDYPYPMEFSVDLHSLKFWRYNKASLGELVPLEILGKHQQDLPRGIVLPTWYFLWSVQGFDQMLQVARFTLLYRQNFMRVYRSPYSVQDAWNRSEIIMDLSSTMMDLLDCHWPQTDCLKSSDEFKTTFLSYTYFLWTC